MNARTDDLPPRLRCEGAQLVKPNGKPIVLRGINLGAVGEDAPQDAEQIRATGANCVRIALRWWGSYGDPAVDSRDDNGFAFLRRANVQDWLDKIIAASAAGLWVIPFIDSDCGQSGTQNPDSIRYCDPYQTWGANGRNFYTDVAMRKVFAQIVWPAAAARLRMVSKIALLELHPEPAGERGPEYAAVVREVYSDIMDAVRAVDPDTPFLVGARGGYDIRHCDEAWMEGRTDCVYTGNLLNQWVVNPDKFDAGLSALTAMRDAREVPVFVQQLGRKSGADADLSLMRRALATMGEAEVGFSWWQWKQNSTAADSYGLNYKGQGGAGWLQKPEEIAALAEAFA